jgi:hypothetical protein
MTKRAPTRSPTGMRPFSLALCLLLALAACDILDPEACHTAIFYAVEPGQVTLEVGESFSPTATIETCPEGKREIPVTWIPADSEVLTLEGNRLIALAAGETTVDGRTVDALTVVTIAVTVVEP